jgi:hypothetical protein
VCCSLLLLLLLLLLELLALADNKHILESFVHGKQQRGHIAHSSCLSPPTCIEPACKR